MTTHVTNPNTFDANLQIHREHDMVDITPGFLTSFCFLSDETDVAVREAFETATATGYIDEETATEAEFEIRAILEDYFNSYCGVHIVADDPQNYTGMGPRDIIQLTNDSRRHNPLYWDYGIYQLGKLTILISGSPCMCAPDM